jgi:hypothetical protein
LLNKKVYGEELDLPAIITWAYFYHQTKLNLPLLSLVIVMPKPRSQQISLFDTPYYHICSRTVRKAFLCGVDKETSTSFEHRRTWIEKRIFQLSHVFAIDICAHAVMRNHLHLVLHVEVKQVKNWSTGEVLERWHQLFKGTLLTQKYSKNENGQSLDKFELAMV